MWDSTMTDSESISISMSRHCCCDDIIEQYKQSDVYAFIEETTTVICSGLYGTSGAGKTRAVYEYLSHNFGFYCLAQHQQ